MALKRFGWLLLTSCLASACGRSTPTIAALPEPEPLRVSRWSDTTELFIEHPPLIVGKTSRFAIHVTHLHPARAASDGEVEAQLGDSGAETESFRVNEPSQPGIFGVDVRPTRAGRRTLVILYRSGDLVEEHLAGDVDVHADAAAAAAAANEGTREGGIHFLKEQQWALDFDTDVIREGVIRPSIRVPGEVAPRPSGAADAVAPIDGRLVMVADLALGASVRRGQELARLQPPPGVPGDLPQLERARTEAIAAYEFATRDRERAERLVTAGAAPQKRLDEARVAETQAAARTGAAEAQLAQYNTARAADGISNDRGLFAIRSPITGVIAMREAATGANVTSGARLFRIVDASLVQVVGYVPEAQVARARLAVTAQIEVPGTAALVPAGRRVSMGKVLDAQTRTLPIVFDLDNTTLGLPIAQAIFLHLLGHETTRAPVVPISSIVDDTGRPIVFVQVGGERFDRRPVTLGAREGDLVQVTFGVSAGERVVTKGAYLVRLASLSTQVPAQGHVH